MRERTVNKEMKMKYGNERNFKNFQETQKNQGRIRKLRKEKVVEENMKVNQIKKL